MTQIFPAEVVVREWPKNMRQEDKEMFQPLQKRHIDPIKINKLQDTGVLANGLLFKGMRVYKQLLLANDQKYINRPNWKGLLSIYLQYSKERLEKDKRYISVNNAYSHTYYHWLLEVLPRLYLTREYFSDSILLLPDNHTAKFHCQSLALFRVKQTYLMEFDKIYQAPQLLVPSQIGRVANYHPQVIKQTVEFIKSQLELKLDLGERIYVSRGKATKRKILNEDEVLSYVQEQGFTSVCLEDYSFGEQISIMHHCRYLVGLHGAGLANMIFMPEDGHIFEFRKYDEGENYFFYTLASTVHLNYYYQFCQASCDTSSVQDADVQVDIECLKNQLKAMVS